MILNVAYSADKDTSNKSNPAEQYLVKGQESPQIVKVQTWNFHYNLQLPFSVVCNIILRECFPHTGSVGQEVSVRERLQYRQYIL